MRSFEVERSIPHWNKRSCAIEEHSEEEMKYCTKWKTVSAGPLMHKQTKENHIITLNTGPFVKRAVTLFYMDSATIEHNRRLISSI